MSQCFVLKQLWQSGNNSCSVSRAQEVSRCPAHWWRRGPWSHWCLLPNSPVKILQTATQQPHQQTNACFPLISALWWKRESQREWLEGMACQAVLHIVTLYVSSFLGAWGVRKKKKHWREVFVCVCVCMIRCLSVCMCLCKVVFDRMCVLLYVHGVSTWRLIALLSKL